MRILILAALILAMIEMARAQLPDAQPPITRFEPQIEHYPQNFAIASDQRNTVYIGNSDGVLTFDGEDWQKTVLPNGEIVRWLAYDGDQRVYVGGFDAFGYLERDEFGQFQYRELSGLFSDDLQGEPFADIWRIQVAAAGVFFVALEHLFLYNPETDETRFWKFPGSFGPIAEHENAVWLQWRGEGIKVFDGSQWSLIEHPTLGTDFLTDFISLSDRLIVLGENQWFESTGEGFSEIEGTSRLPLLSSGTDAIAVGNNAIVFATLNGKVVFFHLGSHDTQVVNVSSGFIPALNLTKSGRILAVDDLGFSSISWPARWQVVDHTTGLAGSIMAIRPVGNRTYVLTSSGVYLKRDAGQRFERIAWTDYEAWDLLRTREGDLLFADSYEIKQVGIDGVNRVLDDSTTARLFVESRFHKNRVYVGTEFGLQMLEKSNAGWEVVFTRDDLTNLTIAQIVEISASEIWLGSERGGIYKVTLDEMVGEHRFEHLAGEQGLVYGDRSQGAYVYHIDGKLLVSTAAGIFRYNGEQFERYDYRGLDALVVPGRTIELSESAGSLWAFYYDRLYRYDAGWQEEDITGLLDGGVGVLETVGQATLVAGMGSYLVFDSNVESGNGNQSAVSLNAATVSETENSVAARLPLNDVRFSSAVQRLTLHFALPDFSDPDRVSFRARMLPLENRFSSWSASSQQSFVDLPPGEYELQIEAMNSHGAVSRTEVPITVESQWFETLWFRGLLLVIAAALTFVAMSYFSRRQERILKHERNVLERKIAERTRELQSANQQLDRMAHLDGLTQIPNRRKLDSYLEDVYLQCVERSRVMAVALVDVDHFKQFNDTHGHQAGDDLLIELARLLSRNLRRAEDLVARYGGEEFLVVLPGAEPESAFRVIDGMRSHVESSDLNVTISAGLHVETPGESHSVEEMIAAADRALYQAKSGGRNRVEVA